MLSKGRTVNPVLTRAVFLCQNAEQGGKKNCIKVTFLKVLLLKYTKICKKYRFKY